ncbi:MAG: PAS domain-containing protein [Firmicutes bacterium]|nr:PAS domain-containing protein [Bacillota bacterium]
MTNLLDHRELLFQPMADAMSEILVLLDDQLRVTFVNDSAKQILGLSDISYQGKDFFSELDVWKHYADRKRTKVHDVLESGVPIKGITRATQDGRILAINIVPVRISNATDGVLITGEDVTHLMAMEQELDLAFALTLPNSKVEYRLKSIPEYRDRFDPKTKQITITGIVKDGGYRHVVNCLKLFSQLTAQGVTRLIGIEKDDLVQAFVYHDLGKSQPDLHVGDVVDPKVVFEEGKLHADRSADMAQFNYGQKQDVVDVIRYHHHGEQELPSTFARRLLPMLRLFQIVDGTSAAMTRGGVDVSFAVHDCTVTIREVNHRPIYNGTRLVNLYTGERQWFPSV